MPESKQAKEKREQYELHSLIANSNGFRLSKTSTSKVKLHLKELERKGFVLFVSGRGWVDATPALRRYKESAASCGNDMGVGISPQVEALESAIIASIELDGFDCQCIDEYSCVSCRLVASLSPESRAKVSG